MEDFQGANFGRTDPWCATVTASSPPNCRRWWLMKTIASCSRPSGRNTAPALTLAALCWHTTTVTTRCCWSCQRTMCARPAGVSGAIDAGVAAAQASAVVTFRIVPDQPETGYGYIRVDGERQTEAVRSRPSWRSPISRRPKPIASGGVPLWNSGLFMMRASVWLKAIDAFNPEMAAACRRAYADLVRDVDFVRVDKGCISWRSPSDSIDYAVMEKLAGSGLGIEAWWCRWPPAGRTSAHGSSVAGRGQGRRHQRHPRRRDSRGLQRHLVFADSRLVAGVGLNDVVVVETPDAVLVARKDRTQDVKKIVAPAQAEQRSRASAHRKVHRPWETRFHRQWRALPGQANRGQARRAPESTDAPPSRGALDRGERNGHGDAR